MANLFDVLRLGESADERRVGLSEDFVVHIADVLCGEHASNTVFSSLLENEFDEVFGGWVPRVWGQIRCHLIHEKQKLEFTFRRLLSEHPIVQFA